MNLNLSPRQSRALLAAVIITRSTAMLFSKLILQTVSPFSLLAIRFLLAFLLLLLIVHRQMRAVSASTLKKGLTLGVVFTGVMTLEMYGLRATSASVTSFLENSAVVLVPLLHAVLIRKMPSGRILCGSVTALIGVGLLTLYSANNQFGFGVLFCLGAACLYSIAILLTGSYSQTEDPLQLGILQVGCIGVCSLLLALVTGSFSFIMTPINYFYVLILAVVCSGFGFTLQPVAQKNVEVDTAGMFCALNPLSCTLLGILVLHEDYTIVSIAGCLLILLGVILPHLKRSKG